MHGVERVVAVVGAAVRELRDLRPLLPALVRSCSRARPGLRRRAPARAAFGTVVRVCRRTSRAVRCGRAPRAPRRSCRRPCVALMPWMSGDDVYDGCPGVRFDDAGRAGSRPVPLGTRDTTWLRGTCSTICPSRFKPPVSSWSTSHGSHPVPFHASHTSGGFSGSTPTPSMWHVTCSATAQLGTASLSARYKQSPTSGVVWKAANCVASLTWSVRSTHSSSLVGLTASSSTRSRHDRACTG